MKPCRAFIPAFLLLAFATSNCGQTKQKAPDAAVPPPHFIWKYDTGG